MKSRLLTFFALLLMCLTVSAVEMETVVYVERDSVLKMDVYFPDDTLSEHPCLIFAFGGGFRNGTRNSSDIVSVMRHIASRGIVCASIDYRLGLKNKSFKNPIESLPYLVSSVEMATEDMLAAGAYIYTNAEALKVDKNLIMASGSSAGAIMSLQADYYLHSDNEMASVLPAGFKFAGVLSFAGAVTSFGDKIKYTSQPAPTFFVHGTKDKLVPYTHMSVAGKGMYGSDYLTDLFSKNGWRYEILRYENFGHEVSWIGIKENIPEIFMFIERFVLNKGSEARYGASLDITRKEPGVKKPLWQINGLNLYKKGENPTVAKDSAQIKRLYGNF